MKLQVPVTVVIPTYNRKDSLINTINSYLEGNNLPSEIIIVDQTIPALSLDNAFDNKDRVNIRLIHCEKPSSTMARNIGIQNSQNDIILFSDDDVLVDAFSIKQFYNMMKHKAVALCVGVNASEKKEKTSIIRKLVGTLIGMQNLLRSGGYIVQRTMRGRYSLCADKDVYATEWAMGYFFGIKKSLTEKWSVYFDENLIEYAYAEDLDFSLRYCKCARKEKLNCVIDKSIYVNHLATQEWRTPSQKAMFFLIANRLYLLHKNFPQYSSLLMRWNNFCYSLMLPKNSKKTFRFIQKNCFRNLGRLQSGKIKEVYKDLEKELGKRG